MRYYLSLSLAMKHKKKLYIQGIAYKVYLEFHEYECS